MNKTSEASGQTTAPARKAASRAGTAKPVKAAPKPVAAAPAKVAKTAAKTAAKAVAKTAAKASPKPAKIKLVRDSFTMPSDEYALLGELKQRALAGAHPVKKSELLRAGVKLLAGLGDAALLRALKQVPTLKTGRPKAK
ncbi:hypothetical protein [Pelomonas sp. KK5]|uniref:hypothetical protein n=1 Tax=Pelomonas sp. KK5 TaxID=1855730 RepID=UPI00097C3327|nr:hypothetical protein [Pelomonas sp. KK5]